MIYMTTSEDYAQAFAQQLRVEMVDRGIQQSALAIAIGIRPETMSRYMTGKMDFKFPHVVAIAEELGMGVSELLARTEARLER